MDKLKPVLAHKFWILCGVALILPILGYFIGRGNLAAAVEAREQVINGLSVPDGSKIPNEDWVTKAKAVQDERQERLDTAGNYLWDAQKQYMPWPAEMRPFVEGKIFETDTIEIGGRQRYRGGFDSYRQDLWRTVEPLEFDERTQKYRGKVAFDISQLPLPDSSIWPGAAPESKEIWYLQEEMWLLRSLLQSIRNVNDEAGADSIVKAPVKQIDLLQLQGGNMAVVEGSGEAEEGFEDAGPGGGHGGAGGSRGMGGSNAMPSMGGVGGGAAGGATLEFDLAEEVGPNTPVATADESGLEGDSEMASPSGAHGGLGGMASPMGGAGGSASPNPLMAEKRYVDDDKTAPFKTRAFKMQVVMDHKYLPEFLAGLTNSPFPVRILRVHWAEMNPDPRFAGGSFGGELSGGGGRGGMGAMGGRGMGAMGGRGGASPMGGRGMGAMGGRGGMGAMGGRGMGSMPRGMGGMGSTAGRGGAGAMPRGMGGMGSTAGRGGMGAMGGRGMGAMGGRGMAGAGARGMTPMPGARGMGAMGNRGAAGMAMPNMGVDGFSADSSGGDIYAQAMANPYLATVVVGGLITIYRSPEEMAAAAAAEGADGSTETSDAASADAAAGGTEAADEADPAAGSVEPSDTDTVPVDGQADPAAAEVEPGSETTPAESAPADSASETVPAGDTPSSGVTDESAAPAADGTTPAGDPTADPAAPGTPSPPEGAPAGEQPPPA